MTKSWNDKITEDRLLKQNPYAHLNEWGGFSALPNSNMKSTEASNAEITQSRLLLNHPYAHLDEDAPGGFSALSSLAQPNYFSLQKKNRYSGIEIERTARNIQNVIWKHRKSFWPNGVPANPIDMLDPILALNSIGYHADFADTLGEFHSDGKLVEVAGTIDNHLKKVRISRRFADNISRFTAAHELGHALLHNAVGLHRDKPLDGAKITREPTEFEADKFATYFLMPRNLVHSTFKRFFLTDKFLLNEETAFALDLSDYETIKNKYKNLRQLSRMLASTEYYNGLRFISLASQFKVSTEAMAIRLEELELVSI